MAGKKIEDHPENSEAGKQAKTDAEQADKAIADRAQAVADEETAQGFRGVKVDPTPNEAYTVSGVTTGQPTPETDLDAAEAARQGQRDAETRAAGVAER